MTRMDTFAEHMADGLTTPQIRQRMNLTKGQAAGFLKRIRDSLGEQAK